MEGAIAISGTLAQPTAGGQVTLREGGELTVGRGRIRVQRGTVELNGYPAGARVEFDGATRVSGVLLVRARGRSTTCSSPSSRTARTCPRPTW